MAYLAASIAVVGLLAAANLLFTFGVIRRLREHTAELANLRRGGARGGDIVLPVGSPVGAFSAESVDGRSVTLDTLGARPLVGFLSPTCTPCRERLPGFIEYAASRPAGREGVLAVVVGSPEQTAEVVEQVRPVATVVVEPDQGPVQQAFGVAGFPAFVLVHDGVVEASDYELNPVTERHVDGSAEALQAAG